MDKSSTIKSFTEPYTLSMIANGFLFGTLSGIFQTGILYMLMVLLGGFDTLMIYR